MSVKAKAHFDGEPTVDIGVAVPRLQPSERAALWISRTGPI